MDLTSLIFTAAGTVAGIAAAYFGWLAVRPRRNSRELHAINQSSSIPASTTGSPLHFYDVFVSYSPADSGWVDSFCAALSAAGIKIARDDVVTKPGDIWVHSIERAIRDSSHGIVVFSLASLTDGWLREEYASLMQRSIEMGRRLIPVLIDDVDLPEFATSRYFADYRNVSKEDYDRITEAIVSVVK